MFCSLWLPKPLPIRFAEAKLLLQFSLLEKEFRKQTCIGAKHARQIRKTCALKEKRNGENNFEGTQLLQLLPPLSFSR